MDDQGKAQHQRSTFRLRYLISPRDAGVRFEMTEVFSGLMLPMIAGSLPDFAPSFEAYARDLKAAAEARATG